MVRRDVDRAGEPGQHLVRLRRLPFSPLGSHGGHQFRHRGLTELLRQLAAVAAEQLLAQVRHQLRVGKTIIALINGQILRHLRQVLLIVG